MNVKQMIDVGLAHKGMAGKDLAYNMGKDPSSISQMKKQKTVIYYSDDVVTFLLNNI